jgi:hypothetical protein
VAVILSLIHYKPLVVGVAVFILVLVLLEVQVAAEVVKVVLVVLQIKHLTMVELVMVLLAELVLVHQEQPLAAVVVEQERLVQMAQAQAVTEVTVVQD